MYNNIHSSVIERCKKGERKAFREIYDLYAKAMFNIADRILNNTEEAEEVLQDAFLKAFKNIARYDANYSFGIWLKRIVINTSLDVLKKRKINFVPLEEAANHEGEPEEGDDEIVYDVDTIMRCIKELPAGYRTILSLFLFEDYSHKEIAELLNISEGTSKSQYNRGKKKLVELIKETSATHERQS